MSISKNSSIFIAGHNGMVGKSIHDLLLKENYSNIITAERIDLNLLDQLAVKKFFKKNKIDYVFMCAAKVGGIDANSTYPADFIYENLQIQLNVINQCHQNDVNNLLFLGSSCIYPKHSIQPINESQLLQGPLEETNQWYAIAKIAGIKLCESFNIQYDRDYRCIMPTNLYGNNDNFHPINSHVIPALIRRFHEAKINNADSISIWGTGKPKREFLHVEDMAKASVHIANLSKNSYLKNVQQDLSHINIGTGNDISIKDLVKILCDVCDYSGKIFYDSSKPDGTPRKVLDTKKINDLGWSAEISLRKGLLKTYNWYVENYSNITRK
jgi:GDP-L-fucose synthase